MSYRRPESVARHPSTLIQVRLSLLGAQLIMVLFVECSSNGPSSPSNQNHPPTAEILSPAPGTYDSRSLTFQGTANDPEDGPLTGPSLVWTSSQQGQIGTGSLFTYGDLADGIHTITLIASDSRGTSGVASIQIMIVERSSSGVALQLSNEDGFLDGTGTFQSARESFLRGDGGPNKPDSLVYELAVGNSSDVTATGVRVDDLVAPHTSLIDWRQTLFISQGTVTNSSGNGFRWNVGELQPNTFATLRFRAHALRQGNAVNRATLVADQLDIAIIDEELTSIEGLEMHLSNVDGFLDVSGTFQGAREAFSVGDGGFGGDSLVFELQVINESATRRATGITVIDLVAPHSGIFAWRQILFASQGTVIGASVNGFTWNIGDLPPRVGATLRFRAEALASGDDVNRTVLSFDQLGGVVVLEEATHIE